MVRADRREFLKGLGALVVAPTMIFAPGPRWRRWGLTPALRPFLDGKIDTFLGFQWVRSDELTAIARMMDEADVPTSDRILYASDRQIESLTGIRVVR